jgi:hypothetical protein
VTTIKIQDLAPIPGMQPHALTVRHFDRILSEDLRQV